MGNAILDQRGGDSLTATTLDGYSLLADTTVSSATTTVNFTGLNIGWGDELLLVSDIALTSTSSCDFYLYVNGNTVSSNYWTQGIESQNTTIGSGRWNIPVFSYNVGDLARINGFTNIKVSNNGFFTFLAKTLPRYGQNNMYLRNYNGTSTFTISSITSLTISSAISNHIGVGSRFQLYKSGGGASRTWAIT